MGTTCSASTSAPRPRPIRPLGPAIRDWTILRPGRLNDDPGTGQVRIEIEPFRGQVARDDVAAVLARLLHEPRAVGQVLYVNGGHESIEAALEACLGQVGQL